MIAWRFYRKLWREAEADRRAAEKELLDQTRDIVALLEALGVDDNPDPVVRGHVRQLQRWANSPTL